MNSSDKRNDSKSAASSTPRASGTSTLEQNGRKSSRSVGRSSSKLAVEFSRDLIEEDTAEEQPTEQEDASGSSEPSYEEYEEYEEDTTSLVDSSSRRYRGRTIEEPRRVLSSRVPPVAATSRTVKMTRGKRGRRSPRAKPVADEKSATDSEEPSDPRERAIKELKEEIRLEEYEQKRDLEPEAKEAAIREKQLKRTQAVFSRHWSVYSENERIIEQEERWARYLTCDGLPDPESLPELNAFAYLWSTEEEDASMDNVEEKRHAAISLLSNLEEIVRFSIAIPEEYKAEQKEIATELRSRLQRWIDLACYRLLRHIEDNTIMDDSKTIRYVRATEKLVCCFWAPITLPVGMKRPTVAKDRKSIEVRFEEMQLTIKLPSDIDCHSMAIRGLWLAHDHYSTETRSRRMPELPDRLLGLWGPSPDLLEFERHEYEEKLRIREEQVEGRRLRLEEKKAMLELLERPPTVVHERRNKRGKKNRPRSRGRDKRPELDSALLSKTESLPYLSTPYETVRQREDEAKQEVRRLLFTRCEKTEVNLRKYRILGGVFRVDLLYQPPQPKDLGNETYLTTLELPKEPKFVAFSRRYVTPEPVPDSERTPEAIEAEMRALEEAMEALVLITVRLPDSILWFEPPLIAQWIPEKGIWSTKHVHDVKFNEEQRTIAFRSGRLGVHGLAAYKFANLPFQSWELKPETGKTGRDHGGVVLAVTAATIQAEFVVREDRVCLNSLTGQPNDPLKGILGEYDDLDRLIERLQRVGCDLFPDRDAISYLTGINAKHPAAERHLRLCMAMLSTAYTFAWSRWNATRDFRQIVLQLKEMHGCLAKEVTRVLSSCDSLIDSVIEFVLPEAYQRDAVGNAIENHARTLHRGQSRVLRITVRRARHRVLLRPVSSGAAHRRRQEPTRDGEDLVQIGIDGRSAPRENERYRHVILIRLDL